MSGDEPLCQPVSRPYVKRFDYVYSLHVFQKLRLIDLGLAEFEQLLGGGEVIEELRDSPEQTREIVLLVEFGSAAAPRGGRRLRSAGRTARHRIRASTPASGMTSSSEGRVGHDLCSLR